MYEGFILDRGDHNSKNLQKWVEGEPEKSFFLGIRTNDRDKYEVSTYRCDRCGYLESYAQTPSK
jgi:DNA gyrase inhibitor GyrI